MSADDKTPEPHPRPLPLTRQWVEDYKRYGTEPKPEGAESPIPYEQWLKDNPPPDLQELARSEQSVLSFVASRSSFLIGELLLGKLSKTVIVVGNAPHDRP